MILNNNIFFTFLIPFLAGLIIIPILIVISKKTNFLIDVPKGDPLKIHKKNIPLSGGLAMIASFLISTSIFLGEGFEKKIIGTIISLLLIFLLGFWDDLKWKHISQIKPLLKFFLLILCTFISAVILFYVGIKFYLFPLTILTVILDFIYIFIVINAINYQDGMDGLAGGLVFISLLGFAFLSLTLGNAFALLISLISMGAVLSFLVFNFPSAKIFMGDSGAYSLGFILTILAVSFSKPHNIYSAVGPIFIIGIPIFDGVFTNIRRLVAGKSIFLGDRSHFYDKLLQKRFSTKKTVLICYSFQMVSMILGITIYIYA